MKKQYFLVLGIILLIAGAAFYEVNRDNIGSVSSLIKTDTGSTSLLKLNNLITAHNNLEATTSMAQVTSLPNLATVGIITSGTWSGTAIADNKMTKTGDWTGTLDGYEASALLGGDGTVAQLGQIGDVSTSTLAYGHIPMWDGSNWQDTATGSLGISGSMTYPGVGIALSTGAGWDAPITNNSANWNTAYNNASNSPFSLFVNRNDWATIDNYPSACVTGVVTGIGDTLTCVATTSWASASSQTPWTSNIDGGGYTLTNFLGGTSTGDIYLDDNSGSSPTLSFLDDDTGVASMGYSDVINALYIKSNDEIRLLPSGLSTGNLTFTASTTLDVYTITPLGGYIRLAASGDTTHWASHSLLSSFSLYAFGNLEADGVSYLDGGASTTNLTVSTNLWMPSLATPAGSFLAVDGNGLIIATTSPTGSMAYPGAGIALSTGSGWDTSIINNSANWNTTYGWGNHATQGYMLQSWASSTYLQLSATTSMPSDNTWTLHGSYPTACSAGQYVSAVGDTLTCGTPAGGIGESLWASTTLNNGIYYNSGNVGIGTSTPSNGFQVYNYIKFDDANFNTSVGYDAGNNSISSSSRNTAIGYEALSNSMVGVSSGLGNVAVGYHSLKTLKSGTGNTGLGYEALTRLSDNSQNNTAVGFQAANYMTTGYQNTAVGMQSLFYNTTGDYNTVLGVDAAYFNQEGDRTTAIGFQAGAGYIYQKYFNSSNNVFVGYQAGYGAEADGNNNTYLGYRAGYGMTTGSYNIIIGSNAEAVGTTSSQQLNIGNLIFGTGLYNGSTISSSSVSAGKIGLGTTTPEAKLDVWGIAAGKILTLFSDTGTKFMEMLNTGVTTLLGTWDFSGATVKQHTYPAFSYATSTSWTGTTTIPLGVAYNAESWSGVKCYTDTGTVNVSFYDGTNRMNLFNASTTVNQITFTTNNTFTASEKRYVDVGTPASTPTKISCSIDKIVNN